jgi:protein-S-isoprenylcysteine O-methyltransferase Ste14
LTAELGLIALAWLAYGALHSWLASHRFKQRIAARWPAAMPAYRLGFNLSATLLLVPVLWFTHRYVGEPVWSVPAWIAWPALAIALAGFAWSMKSYDGATFLGLRQWRKRIGPDAEREAFTLSPLHRHVRHPWYALGLLLLWTRDLNAAWLVAASAITFYLLIGSRLEENKLIALYGEAYRRYRQRVPALIPLPGRALSADEARALEALARTPPAAACAEGAPTLL